MIINKWDKKLPSQQPVITFGIMKSLNFLQNKIKGRTLKCILLPILFLVLKYKIKGFFFWN